MTRISWKLLLNKMTPISCIIILVWATILTKMCFIVIFLLWIFHGYQHGTLAYMIA